MTKHYCDCCHTETTNLYGLPIYVHIKDKKDYGGYARFDVAKNTWESMSGRIEDTELCLVCYNELMTPMWEHYNQMCIEKDNKIDIK